MSKKFDPAVPDWVVVILFVIFIVGLVAFTADALGSDWDQQRAACYPNFDDFDYRYKVGEGPDVIVWWCDTPDGVQTNARAGELGKAVERLGELVLEATRDPASFDLAVFFRPLTDLEQITADEMYFRFAPRCFVDTTAQTAAIITSTSQNTPGPNKVDAAGKAVRIKAQTWVSCGWRLKVAKRYCLATGLKDTLDRMLETDSWVACRIQRAPDTAKGWE